MGVCLYMGANTTTSAPVISRSYADARKIALPERRDSAKKCDKNSKRNDKNQSSGFCKRSHGDVLKSRRHSH